MTTNARLTRIKITNFKSYGPTTVEVPLRPITLLVGRNNSGKSSIIQALLLLKQTLEQPRGNEALVFHGTVPVPAGALADLTHGWPDADDHAGPTITIEWITPVDVQEALRAAGNPNQDEFASKSGISWVQQNPSKVVLNTSLELKFGAKNRRVYLEYAALTSRRIDGKKAVENPSLRVTPLDDGEHDIRWGGSKGLGKLVAEWDHFLPFVSVNRRHVGPRHSDRGRANGFLLLYDQPLAELKELLLGLAYLSSARPTPQPVYQPAGGELNDVGFAGERAAQVLHFRKSDAFHYLPPLTWDASDIPTVPTDVVEEDLDSAIRSIFKFLGVDANFSTKEIANIGFTVLFGRSSLFHVGRGISYLLPLVELSLLGDALAGEELGGPVSLDEYDRRTRRSRQIAVEEPESHLHPAVHGRLAHLLVSTAMSGRQWLVETHSDHMVRRLRRLAAAAPSGSPLETWLCSKVAIVEVTQSSGVSTVSASNLTASGDGSTSWPAEFMDQATREEDSIYLARLGKEPAGTDYDELQVEHRPHDEDDSF
ncbi:MAG: AAA family ATPase [Myxococcales bacterium]|nr:AAA family ATPase [Myxococcales bacterium]MCB9610826.1 AAA family ATPase [Polyangiaceae bacterium]